MRRRSMQHDFTLEMESTFFQHAPGGEIDGAYKPNNALRLQIVMGESQRLPHQLGRIAVSPMIRM